MTDADLITKLCEHAVRIRKRAVDIDGRATEYLLSIGELSGIRIALAYAHGWEDHSSNGPVAEFIIDWWQRNHPEDWIDGTAHRNVLYFELQDLLRRNSQRHTIADVARAMCAPTSTAYRVFGAPAEVDWNTLLPYIEFLGGKVAYFEKLWCDAKLCSAG